MSKLYSVSIEYTVIDEHQIRANSIEEAEDEILRMAQNDELSAGNIYDARMEDAEIYSSSEVEK